MYRLGEWDIIDDGASADAMLENGVRLFAGNGYLGRRGVPDDAGPEAMPATILSGLYDKRGDLWREPVNAPDPLYTAVSLYGSPRLLIQDALSHEQSLNFRYGIYSRKTVWRDKTSGAALTVHAERFADMADVHRICARHTFSADKPLVITVKTGINCAVRDLNGPHLGTFVRFEKGFEKSAQKPAFPLMSVLIVDCETLEKHIPLETASVAAWSDNAVFSVEDIENNENGIFRLYTFELDGKNPVECRIYGAFYTGLDAGVDAAFPVTGNAEDSAIKAAYSGWDATFRAHKTRWDAIWFSGDVVIEGDDYARRCLRYSLYHLQCIAPRHGKALSIPARGLSGQTYKGAIFWDTEMFIAPYFLATEPELAARLVRYRIQTLPGAKRKAAEYGFRGAFYAWESQESGDDACSDFNVIDVFTERPVRTYFRDRQIHISADIVWAVKRYVDATGDANMLKEGALEMVYECARFFLSYLYYSPERKRYEVLDVVGPDEYHERVNNNAFTNRMIQAVFDAALEYTEYFRLHDAGFIDDLIKKLDFEDDLAFIRKAQKEFYMPLPDERGIIEQFDRYFKLEDCTLDTARSRLKDPKEYWGCGNGVAFSTQIIKQADVVAMLALFGNDYSEAVKKANLDYYEPRTEHGSSLSACMYALLSCDTGASDWAYPFFIASAEIDSAGKGKHFAGLIYIGGAHPAASGGAWMVAAQGFCGFSIEKGEISVKPRLPSSWKKVVFKVKRGGSLNEVAVTKTGCSIRPADSADKDCFGLHMPMQGAIFDLDGVLVDTAKCHYLAWKRLADELGVPFSEKENERFKGVSRARCMEILAEIGNLKLSEREMEQAASKKNRWYTEYVYALDESALLPGARDYLVFLRRRGVKTALGSASKNASLILRRLHIDHLFDAIIDGNAARKAKPDPEVFVKGALALDLPPESCVVFEDSLAGIEAAKRGGMKTIAVGTKEILPGADTYIRSLQDMLN
ncbi:MAG: beta-phosphoglucomutase [Treponema sp.]|jgi:beta-phosphoglucomutase|nr:beta-phosphoglucomutase [Treponema sp.]